MNNYMKTDLVVEIDDTLGPEYPGSKERGHSSTSQSQAKLKADERGAPHGQQGRGHQQGQDGETQNVG